MNDIADLLGFDDGFTLPDRDLRDLSKDAVGADDLCQSNEDLLSSILQSESISDHIDVDGHTDYTASTVSTPTSTSPTDFDDFILPMPSTAEAASWGVSTAVSAADMHLDFMLSSQEDATQFSVPSPAASMSSNASFTSVDSSHVSSMRAFLRQGSEVVVKCDLSTPMRTLRMQLCEELGEWVSDVPILLQSAPIGEDQSVAEHCTRRRGAAEFKLQVSEASINIVDVFERTEEEMLFEELNAEISFPKTIAEEDISTSRKVSTKPPPAPRIAIAPTERKVAPPQPAKPQMMTFRKSPSFASLALPQSVSSWTSPHVLQWVRWLRRSFPGVSLEADKWKDVCGGDLAAMDRDDFNQRVRHDRNGFVWQHLTVLRQVGLGCVPTAESDVAALTASPPAKKSRVVLGRYEQGVVLSGPSENSNVTRSGNNGITINLWKFLLEMLTDNSYSHLITWLVGSDCEEGEFKMCEPEVVARMWGERKNRPNMNYEKLSRAIRHYKGGNILSKVPKKRFTYRFVCDLREIIGYDARQLVAMMRAQKTRPRQAVGANRDLILTL